MYVPSFCLPSTNIFLSDIGEPCVVVRCCLLSYLGDAIGAVLVGGGFGVPFRGFEGLLGSER